MRYSSLATLAVFHALVDAVCVWMIFYALGMRLTAPGGFFEPRSGERQ
jgi:hypothetical protein